MAIIISSDTYDPTITETVYETFSKKYTLSKRQIECLFYMSFGYSMKETAQKINVSPRTIETHINALKEKLNVTLRSQLVCFFHKAFMGR